jgi:hypothetical protein
MRPRSEARREQLTVYIVILLTGFTLLVYEVSWNRMLSLVLGTTVAASTIVLASFMAGIGAGAYYWGYKADRATYAVILPALLGGIGLAGAINYFLIADALPHIYAAFSGSMAADAVVLAVAAGLLLIQTFLQDRNPLRRWHRVITGTTVCAGNTREFSRRAGCWFCILRYAWTEEHDWTGGACQRDLSRLVVYDGEVTSCRRSAPSNAGVPWRSAGRRRAKAPSR